MKRLYPHGLVLCVLSALLYGGVLGPLQDALTDFRFRMVQRPATGQVVVVAIDSQALQDVGVWPWPRRVHAEFVQKLQAAGVADIVFDVDFSARSSKAEDTAFAEALREAGGSVVLPAFKQAATGGHGPRSLHVNRALPEFRAYAWEASVNVVAEPDGRIRRYAVGDVIEGTFVPSAATMLASTVFDNKAAPFHLDFSIKLSDIPIISISEVLSGKAGAASLTGKKAIVGGTAIELGDRYLVPNAGVISGPKLHALAAESILQGRMLSDTSNALMMTGLVGLVLLMMALTLWWRSGLATRTIVLLCFSVTIETAAFVLQTWGNVIVHTAAWHAAVDRGLEPRWLEIGPFRSPCKTTRRSL